MAHPRFALVNGGTRAASTVSTWPYGERAVGVPAGNGSWFAWRLLGGNNRELGRSAAVHPSPAACREAAATVRARIDELTAVLASDVRQGQWRWRLDDAHSTLAVSSRLYLRQRECTYNLAQFIAGAPIAELWGGDGDDGEPMPADDSLSADTHLVIDLTGVVPTRRIAPRSQARALAPVVPLPAPEVSLTTRARLDAVLVRRRHRLPVQYPVIRSRSS